MEMLIKSKSFIITIGIISLLAIFLIQKRDVIFQEGNPIPMAISMSDMVFQDKEIAEIQGADGINKYLVKRGEMEPYIQMMEKDGWRFLERDEIANNLKFEKGNTTKSIAYQYYTRWYTIIYS